MINPKELRLGNAVFKKDALINGAEMQIKERLHFITANDIYHIVEDGDPTNHPIPLTPEWLERMGYVKDSTDKKWYKSPHDLPPVYCWRMGDYGMEGLPLSAKSFQYVHQLQNLYFVLIGEELTINHEVCQIK